MPSNAWRPSIALIPLLILLHLLPASMRSEDWPQWRGMNRDGTWRDTGLLESFPASGLQVLWQTKIGPGWSSPVISEGRVCVTDVEMNKPRAWERVHCFDEATGKPLWTHRYEALNYPEGCFAPGQENGPGSTPLVHQGKVYTLGETGKVFCLDSASGNVVWHRSLGADYQTKPFTSKASPLIEGNLLLLVVGGKPDACVIALDKDTGKDAWRALDEDSDNSSPIIVTSGGTRQLVVWTQQSVSSLNPASGTLLWRERLLTSSDNAVSTPVSQGNLLLIAGLMFQLDDTKAAPTVLWPDTRSVSHRVLSNTSTALIREGHVYSAKSSGAFVCLDALTGKQKWTTDQVTVPKSGASIHVTGLAGSDAALLYNDQGELIRARLSPEGYEEISRTLLLAPDQPFGGKKLNWSPPSYANGKVFVRNQHTFLCASLKK